MGFRGRTFSPAEDWKSRDPEFALRKLAEVGAMLMEESKRDISKRSERRNLRQREYDFRDAATTIADAIHVLDIRLAPTAARAIRTQEEHEPKREVQIGPYAQNAWLQLRDGGVTLLRWEDELEQVWAAVDPAELREAVIALCDT